MTIIRIAWHTLDAHHQAFFVRLCDTNFNAKFIGLMDFSFHTLLATLMA